MPRLCRGCRPAAQVIRKNPEEFKINALTVLRTLWPQEHNPFYAGFGNRDSDVVAYTEAGVPSSRILVINPQGEIRLGGQVFTWASYPQLLELCHHMFPFLITDDDEVQLKTRVWEEMNRDYLEEQAERAAARSEAEAAGAELGDEAGGSGGRRGSRRRHKLRRRRLTIR